MGHVRLRRIPKSRDWTDVVNLMGGGADVIEIAAASAHAMTQAIDNALKDPALTHTTYLLAAIPGAARNRDVYGALHGLGIDVGRNFDLADLVAGIASAVERDSRRRGGRTDLGEMALQAAASSLTQVLAPDLPTLIGTSPRDLVRALSKLGTPSRFAELSRAYYGELIRRGLEYYISRVQARFVRASGPIDSLDALKSFRAALALHCSESTRILEQYSAEWFSKAKFRDGISRESAERFARTSLKKLRNELIIRSQSDG